MILNPYIHSLVYAKVFIGVYYLWKYILLLTQKSFNPIIRFLVIYINTNNFNSTQFKNIKMIKKSYFHTRPEEKVKRRQIRTARRPVFSSILGPFVRHYFSSKYARQLLHNFVCCVWFCSIL